MFWRGLSGQKLLVLVPALALCAYWIAGETALITVALGLPLFGLLAGGTARLLRAQSGSRDCVTGLPGEDTLEEKLEVALTVARTRRLKTACILVGLEGVEVLAEQRGTDTADAMLRRMAERLQGALRDDDCLSWIGDGTFGIALHAVPNLDLEAAIQLSVRLQRAVEEPAAIDGAALYLSAAVGICLSSRAPAKSGASLGAALIEGARSALDEARQNGPSGIRVYSTEMRQLRAARQSLRDGALRALENGEIAPWFQPQISTDTGRITGFEALARWAHPRRGIVPPAEFLPVLARAGQMERLGEAILYGALKALTIWDAEGLDVPCVAVNFSGEELQNPRLADKVRWDLDRFDLTPDRLTVEVLETVVVGAAQDAATQNIMRFSEMGCRIDLDDFGTGHASISAIRRFAIERIKIDRSFVTGVDDDPEQQRMVSAILTMAERLGLETLGEGVETAGEHAMLAQLGCDHVQGFGLARPMPFEQTVGWIRAHDAALAPVPQIGRSAS
nr:phosphodiesterase [Aquicoccus sp. G2-2]MEA1113818.1 phosphodiesterase [Aquicoccus sp. G2-2]